MFNSSNGTFAVHMLLISHQAIKLENTRPSSFSLWPALARNEDLHKLQSLLHWERWHCNHSTNLRLSKVAEVSKQMHNWIGRSDTGWLCLPSDVCVAWSHGYCLMSGYLEFYLLLLCCLPFSRQLDPRLLLLSQPKGRSKNQIRVKDASIVRLLPVALLCHE